MARLTEEMVIARTKQSDLGSIKKLNCWGSELADVSIIRRMRGVEVLALSVNKISTLSDFENCRSLQELYLRKNNIQDINDLAYLQNLPHLKNLWLEENPCVENAGPNYRMIVLRALPNLKKLDNVDVTPEEVDEALKGCVKHEEPSYEDAQSEPPPQASYQAPPPAQQSTPQQHQQPQQGQQWRHTSPVRELARSVVDTVEEVCDLLERNVIDPSPVQRTSPIDDLSPVEQGRPPSPYGGMLRTPRELRGSYQQFDKSAGSEQDLTMPGARERGPPIASSMSTHSMKEYYHSDYPKPPPQHYRHSQNDLTEWDDQQQQAAAGPRDERYAGGNRRSCQLDREQQLQGYRNGNGSRDKDDWEDGDRMRNRRFNDSQSVLSHPALNHFMGYHRRPVNRSSNLLSATLCLVKELDCPSLEVVEHAIRMRIDELTTDQ